MGVVMGVTAVIVGMAAALLGLILWTALLFPRSTASARSALESRPGRCFGRGLVLTLLIGVPAIAMLRVPHGVAKLGGWALAFPLLTMLLLGLSAMSHLLGERLRALSPEITPLGGLVRGGITLELAAIMPFLGWFLFTPIVGITLIGAGAAGCLSARNSAGETEAYEQHREPESAAEHERHGSASLPAALTLLSVFTAVFC
jgi:hypothetical protein